MNLLRRLADNTSRDSLASKLRRRRFQFFKELMSAVHKKPFRILDVGGTLDFWKRMGFLAESEDIELTLLNLFRMESHYPHVTTAVGDGRDMKEFHDGEFDAVFSNSVIEHVGDFGDRKSFAEEVRRVGNAYFIQTPNLYFPIEPHFLFPFFQFLPVGLKALLLKHFTIGWHWAAKDIEKAKKTVSSVRLLGKTELARLFPDGQIYRERLLGMTKSLIVLRPWSISRERGALRKSAG
ncbi:class I SAM-dependent methyltransferase [bacterium]|nr:class I SAM-dependent methyltransferase [bacterium]